MPHVDPLPRAETPELRGLLFSRVRRQLEEYLSTQHAQGRESAAAKFQYARFAALWELVDEAGLEDDYELWRQEKRDE